MEAKLILGRWSVGTGRRFTIEVARQVGEALGIDWRDFDVEQFRMGMDVELEHGLVDPHTNVTNDDQMLTGKIALAHLREFPDYYDRLAKLEKEARDYWARRRTETASR